MKKRSIVILALMMIFANFGTVFADTLDNPITEVYEVKENINISPRYIPYTETYYSESRNIRSYNWDWMHEHDNGTGGQDSVTRSVTRSKFWNASASVKAEAGLILAKTEVGAEVSAGTSKDERTSVTFDCSNTGITKLYFGSKVYETKGYIYEYVRGNLVRKDYVKTDFTFMSASKSE